MEGSGVDHGYGQGEEMSGAKYCGCDPGVEHQCDGCRIKALQAEVLRLRARVDEKFRIAVDINGREITGP